MVNDRLIGAQILAIIAQIYVLVFHKTNRTVRSHFGQTVLVFRLMIAYQSVIRRVALEQILLFDKFGDDLLAILVLELLLLFVAECQIAQFNLARSHAAALLHGCLVDQLNPVVLLSLGGRHKLVHQVLLFGDQIETATVGSIATRDHVLDLYDRMRVLVDVLQCVLVAFFKQKDQHVGAEQYEYFETFFHHPERELTLVNQRFLA